MSTETKTKTETETPTEQLPAGRPPLVRGTAVAPIIPRDIDQIYRLAVIVSKAKMAPKALASPEAIMVAMMHGMEVGMTPMVAVQSICVINGMPTLYGDGLIGVVRASGLLVDFEESFARDEDGNVTAATCRAVRRGQATPIIRTFTRAQATKAKLINKPGPWSDYPERMMQMRARSWALRDGFADVLRGLKTVEEAEDIRNLEAGPDGIYREAPARPRRADFEGESEAATEPEDTGPAMANPANPQPADAQPSDAQIFMSEEGEDRVFATIEDAAKEFTTMIKTISREQLVAVWSNNEGFRNAVKITDPALLTAAEAAYKRRVVQEAAA